MYIHETINSEEKSKCHLTVKSKAFLRQILPKKRRPKKRSKIGYHTISPPTSQGKERKNNQEAKKSLSSVMRENAVASHVWTCFPFFSPKIVDTSAENAAAVNVESKQDTNAVPLSFGRTSCIEI
jgi:hypothetical protein